MLVLQRKIGERVVLPDSEVSIVVLGIRGKRVKIGIEAPKNARVHRREFWEKLTNASILDSHENRDVAQCEITVT